MDINGDHSFGHGRSDFYKDQPEAVAQAVKTRLGLIEGEWFLDITKGTPYNTQILGAGTVGLYDFAIQEVITNTPGVTQIVDYSSSVDSTTRKASVNCILDTLYGQVAFSHNL